MLLLLSLGVLDCGTGEMDCLVSTLDPVFDRGLVVVDVGLLDVAGEGVCAVKDGGGVPELSPRTDFVLRFDFLFLMAELEKL